MEPDRDLADVVEALIFASDEPLSAERIGEVIGTAFERAAPASDEIEACVAHINGALEAGGRPYRIEVWGGGYRLATRPEYEMVLRTLFHTRRSGRLTRSLLETVAIIAYRQPVTKPEIDHVRGVDSDYALRRLMEIELVDIAGRSESLGRPLLYATTAKFMDVFGISTLGDLPSLKEIEEILNDPQFDSVRAELLTAQQRAGAAAGDEAENPESGGTEPDASKAAEADEPGAEADAEADADAYAGADTPTEADLNAETNDEASPRPVGADAGAPS